MKIKERCDLSNIYQLDHLRFLSIKYFDIYEKSEDITVMERILILIR